MLFAFGQAAQHAEDVLFVEQQRFLDGQPGQENSGDAPAGNGCRTAVRFVGRAANGSIRHLEPEDHVRAITGRSRRSLVGCALQRPDVARTAHMLMDDVAVHGPSVGGVAWIGPLRKAFATVRASGTHLIKSAITITQGSRLRKTSGGRFRASAKSRTPTSPLPSPTSPLC